MDWGEVEQIRDIPRSRKYDLRIDYMSDGTKRRLMDLIQRNANDLNTLTQDDASKECTIGQLLLDATFIRTDI